ncbi:LpqN/LpqT family lipoprotein [Nocardia panacis]|uniref:LpqN/LpqT family lipoprotein n=1 Tax=Nocardia panacis TaxID=2340916 RepID=UPI0013158284|nr:LpqN/LpqT family lipoprotein [Nocardia panacis]
MSDRAPTIYAALSDLADSVYRVTDSATLPGRVSLDLDADTWVELDARQAGYLHVFARKPERPQPGFGTNIVVVCTRVILDAELGAVLDHAFTESRRLPTWREERATRMPAANRHSGWTFQSGTYSDNARTLYTATRYAVYQRGNVGYLLQVTGTAADAPRYGTLLDRVVYHATLED